MTIQLINACFINGSLEAAGSQHTLDEATEAGLIYQGMATRVGSAPDQDGDIELAYITYDAQGNASLVGADGNIPLSGAFSPNDTNNPPSNVNWLSLRSQGDFAWEALNITSPYSPNHILHPSICDIRNTFAGYRYWLVFTPYPDSDSSFENPCIAASNNLTDWYYPSTNPIVGDPGGSYFNSDADIYYDEAGQQLVVLFREFSGQTKLKVTTTTDGVNWTTPVTIYTSANYGTSTSTDIATPSLWFNDTTSKWEIVGLNAKDAGSAFPVVKITSDSLLSGWDTSATWTVLTLTPPSGRKWWNFQFRRLSSGSVIGIAQDNSGTPGDPGYLYSAYSSDGATFSYKFIDRNAVKDWYRATFLLFGDPSSSAFEVLVIGSKLTETSLFKQYMKLDAETFAINKAGSTGAVLASAGLGNVTGITHADTFNRADDATGLGTSTSGHTYTQVGTSPILIGISGNSAYPANGTGNHRAVRNISVSDYILKYTISLRTSGEIWGIVRYVDSDNYIRVGGSAGGQLTYQVITSAAVSVNQALNITHVVGDEVTIACSGAQILIYLNGKFVAKKISVQGLTATTIGMGMTGASVKMDNLVVIPL